MKSINISTNILTRLALTPLILLLLCVVGMRSAYLAPQASAIRLDIATVDAATGSAKSNFFLGETIAVVFFLDLGLERCQQMFADLNRYALRPSKSIGVLYDHREDRAKLARLVVLQSPVFRDVVEERRGVPEVPRVELDPERR